MAPATKAGKSAEPKLTEDTIESLVGGRSFELGQKYFQSGAIESAVRNGTTIKARCRGRSADFYRVIATLEAGKVTAVGCECPVGPLCKHLAALLLTWLRSPAQFSEASPLQESLQRCDKDELVRLITALVDRVPELEDWLSVRIPGAQVDGAQSPEKFYGQAANAFERAGYDWRAVATLARELEELRSLGDHFFGSSNYASAAAAYTGILEAFIDGFPGIDDEGGDVVSEGEKCLAGLGRCLSHLPAESRRPALKAIVEALNFSIEYGVLDAGSILAAETTSAERATFLPKIRKAAKGDEYSRAAWGRILLQLEEPKSDEDRLKHFREFGLTHELIELLFELGRNEEAVREIGGIRAYDLTPYADLLVERGLADEAIKLVLDRFKSGNHDDRRSRDWLFENYRRRERWPELLHLCREDFLARPNLSSYQEAAQCAARLKSWDKVRPQLLNKLQKPSELKAEILLFEGNVPAAAEVLEQLRTNTRGYFSSRLQPMIAKAAELTHPEIAIRLYQTEAEAAIQLRGRDSYQKACEWLQHVRRLFLEQDDHREWQTYVDGLRDRTKALRAFQEKLKHADLI